MISPKKIIGSAIEVHNFLGTGFQEVIYQRSLSLEMLEKGIVFQREYEINVLYKEHAVGTRRVDFMVENCVLVELKAVSTLESVHLAQAKNYLETSELEIGLLINFGGEKLVFKRIYNSKIR